MKMPSQVPLATPLFYIKINLFELDEHRAERGKLLEGKRLSWLGRPAPTSTIPALENTDGKLSVSLPLREAPGLRRCL